MPRNCTVCGHADREAIEDALFRNKIPFRNVSKQYGLTVSTLFRHAKHTPSAKKPNTKQKVLTSAEELTANLPAKKQTYVEGRLEGKSKRQAALDAGYSTSMADHAAQKIETPDVKEAFAALIRSTISADEVAQTLRAGLQATESKFFAEKGVVQDQRDVVAWGERRLYAELIAEYGGYVSGNDDQKHGGGVILILPDRVRPAPIEGKTVEGTRVDDPMPILILPTTPGEQTSA
jgi:hypothetical protein